MASSHINNQVKKGIDYENAWNNSSLLLVNASEAHCRAFIVETYYAVLLEIIKTASPPLGKVLIELCELYSANTVLKMSGDLLRVNIN